MKNKTIPLITCALLAVPAAHGAIITDSFSDSGISTTDFTSSTYSSPHAVTLGSYSGACASFDVVMTITTGDGLDLSAGGFLDPNGWGTTGGVDATMSSDESLRFDLSISNLNLGGGTLVANNLVLGLTSIEVIAEIFSNSFGTVDSDSGTADTVYMTTGSTTVALGGATFTELTELTGGSWVNNAAWTLGGNLEIDDSAKIPEPSSALLLGLGSLVLLRRIRS